MSTVQIRVVQWEAKPDTLGRKIRFLREEKEMTQADLAKGVGLSIYTIYCVESDKYSPCWRNFTALAKFFGVSLDWLAE